MEMWSSTDVLDAAVAESFEGVTLEGVENLLRSAEEASTPQLLHLPYTIAPRIATNSIDDQNILSSLLMLESTLPPITECAPENPTPNEMCTPPDTVKDTVSYQPGDGITDLLSLVEPNDNAAILSYDSILSENAPDPPEDTFNAPKQDWIDVSALESSSQSFTSAEVTFSDQMSPEVQTLTNEAVEHNRNILKMITADANICRCTSCRCTANDNNNCYDCEGEQAPPPMKCVMLDDVLANDCSKPSGQTGFVNNSCCIMVCLKSLEQLRMLFENSCCQSASNPLRTLAGPLPGCCGNRSVV